jgi:hypothetical protein
MRNYLFLTKNMILQMYILLINLCIVVRLILEVFQILYILCIELKFFLTVAFNISAGIQRCKCNFGVVLLNFKSCYIKGSFLIWNVK